ncbi:hypothetical protein QWY14_05240 [Planococcus sp. N028]|uniref:Helix-turn-helix domain-containing protein n=1 Tax=Planococcus shixiaomingii TaxID=3058393 RepID=A0ABT8MZV9_9BACL|nr:MULTISPECIES: hypothetical protein [unclassified Planococcus (in: firmicutes)]MDN7241183.1 hypothetical protein [Planococcus sp. N028]WKA53452.1 hypothetical protein QWY21_12355 [Planococcus sp. N022]
MSKIQGIKDLLQYFESVDYSITEEQVHEQLAKRKIPHSKSFGDTVFFDLAHIDWWIAEQRKSKSTT